jgi:DNA polymerase III delta subunit
MLKNIFLFTGEEKFLLHQELKRRTDGFVQKYGTDSIFTFKTDNFNLEGLRQALYSGWLFVQKKMCIVYGLPIDGDSWNKLSSNITESLWEELITKSNNLDPELILIFVAYKPDKRTKFYTFLKKNLGVSNIKEFDFLKPAEIKQFIRQYTPNLQRKDATLDAFITKTGTGLLHIINELDKLNIWAENKNSKEISEKDIHILTFAMTGADNFEIFDTLFIDQKKP